MPPANPAGKHRVEIRMRPSEYGDRPVALMVAHDSWAMVRRSDVRNAMPFVVPLRDFDSWREATEAERKLRI